MVEKLTSFYHKVLLPELGCPRYEKTPGIREPGVWLDKPYTRSKTAKKAVAAAGAQAKPRTEVLISTTNVQKSRHAQCTADVEVLTTTHQPSTHVAQIHVQSISSSGNSPCESRPTSATCNSSVNKSTTDSQNRKRSHSASQSSPSRLDKRSRRKCNRFVGRQISHFWLTDEDSGKGEWYTSNLIMKYTAVYEVQYEGEEDTIEVDHSQLTEDLACSHLKFVDIEISKLIMTSSVDFEDVWNTLGIFGVYQFRQMTLTILASLPMAFHIVSVVFIGYRPEHQCSFGMEDLPLGADNNTITDVTNVTTYTCSIHWQRKVDGHVLTKETSCLYGVNYSTPDTSTFIAEWDLVCERDAIGRMSQSLVIGGMFLGALAAPLADKFGRKPVHVAFNIGLFVVTFAMAFVKNVTGFLVLRFFVGTFQHGMLITVVTFWLELLHRDSRENVGIVSAFMWASSVNVLTLVAFLLRNFDWRVLQLALSIFSVFSLVEIFLMDESLRWLIANNKMAQYYALIEKVRKQNKRNTEILPRGGQREVDIIADGEAIMPLQSNTLKNHTTGVVKEHWSQLVTDKILRRHSVITWGVWVANNFTYYGIVMMTPSFAGGRYLSFFFGSISEIVGNFILLLFIKKFTRQTTIIMFQLVGSVALLLTIITTQFNGDAVRIVEVVLFAVGRGAIGNSFNAIYLYTPELFPTNLRNAGFGVASAAGRIAGIIAPFSVYMMGVALWLPSLLFGSLCLTFCFLIRYLPETKGKELPQNIEEIWEWYKQDRNGHVDVKL